MGQIYSLIILVLALGGCVTYAGGRSYDALENFRTSAGNGPVPVSVIGNPFAGGTAKLEGMAAEALKRYYAWVQPGFPVVPAGTPGDKFIFVIDPAKNLSSRDICANPAAAKFDRSGAEMRIGAIFCSGTTASDIWASVDRPGSVDDAGLAQVIDGLSARLIPTLQDDGGRGF